MKGFPKYFNTKQDVLNVIDKYPVQTKEFLQRCLSERKAWLVVQDEALVEVDGKAKSIRVGVKLDSRAIAVNDDTHRVSELRDDRTGVVTERYQEEFKDDPNCKLFRLGFTVQEAESYINAREE